MRISYEEYNNGTYTAMINKRKNRLHTYTYDFYDKPNIYVHILH